MLQPSVRSELVSYPIRDIVQKAKVYEKQGTDMLYFNIGDPAPYGYKPPQHILDAVKEAIDQDYTGYAPSGGDPELKEAIAEQENVSKDDVFVTVGLSEGIDFIYQAMIDPGRNFLLPSPSYPLYITKQRLAYGTINYYECDESLQPDPETIRKGITEHTKGIVVINPNNPTGAVYSRKTIEEIVNIAGEYDLPIIADDVYDRMVFDGEITQVKKVSKDVPVISGNSLSKNYLYPGARVGYLALHGEKTEKLRDTFQRLCNQRLSANWEFQRAYIAALRGNHDHIKVFNSELKKHRDLIVKKCNEIEGLSVAPPKGAFYAFIGVEGPWKDDKEFVYELLKTGVVVVPGSGFSPILKKKYFRMVILPRMEQIEEGFSRIEKFMKGKS